jgi:hypothetical protein
MVERLFVANRSCIHWGFQASSRVKLQRIETWRQCRTCNVSILYSQSVMILRISRTTQLKRAGVPSCMFHVHALGTSGTCSNKKLHGLSPRANYTDRATAACRRSVANFCGYRVPRGQRDGFLWPYSRFSRQEPLLFYQVAPQLYSRGSVDPVPDPLLFFFW